MTECCVFTRGEFFIRDAIVNNCADENPYSECENTLFKKFGKPYRKLGNISSGLVEISAEIIGKENEWNLADPESRNMVSGVNLSLTLNCTGEKNMILSLLGEESVSVSGIGSQEYCIALGSDLFIPFEHKGVDQNTLVVGLYKDNNLVVPFVVDVDYLFSESGVQFIRDDIDQLDTNFLKLSYSYNDAAFRVYEFNQIAPKYKEVYFKGINYSSDDGSELFDGHFYRVLFAPISQIDLITRDEFLTLNLIGTVEKFDGRWFNITRG